MSVRILIGDVRARLAELPAQSVHCVVTNPPYWGLRDYRIEPVVWGGEAGCDHAWGAPLAPRPGRGNKPGDLSTSPLTNPNRQDTISRGADSGQSCARCGAWRGALGLEPTPDRYVAHMVEVFRAVRRVLRRDGTVWLNLGDSYSGSSRGGGKTEKQSTNMGNYHSHGVRTGHGVKPKDLIMIPERVALALQADGWWVRSRIIWAKPNPMPESVTDRPTSAHEHMWLLSKSGAATCWRHRDSRDWAFERPAPDYRWRHRSTGEESAAPRDGPEWRRINLWRGFDYYYDADAVREPEAVPDWDDGTRVFGGVNKHGANPTHGHRLTGRVAGPRKTRIPGGWDTGAGGHGTIHRTGRTKAEYQEAEIKPGRNLRNVWNVAIAPFPDAHFATYPPALIEPCVKAGCPKGGTVLDPFGGAGTTGLVADRLQRDAILIEINPAYAEMAARRIRAEQPMLSDVRIVAAAVACHPLPGPCRPASEPEAEA